MTQHPRGSDDGGLTPEHFEALLNALDPVDRNRAAHLYENLRRKLIRFFEWRGCADPEYQVDVTVNRVARRLHGGVDARDLERYVYGVARLVHQEVLRESARREQVLKSPELRTVSEPADPDPRLEPLQRCLDKMDGAQRRLVLKYYQGDRHIQDRKQIADELGIPINALRIKVHRLRRRLEECLGIRSHR